MRDIKFRAWDKRFNEMYYTSKECTVWMGGAVVSVNTPEGQVFNGDVEYGMQYTGLLDKNGTEIYEGDILSNKDTYGYMVVNWSPTSAGFCLDKKGWIFSHYFKEAVDAEECEVIGNIHENPELLKG